MPIILRNVQDSSQLNVDQVENREISVKDSSLITNETLTCDGREEQRTRSIPFKEETVIDYSTNDLTNRYDGDKKIIVIPITNGNKREFYWVDGKYVENNDSGMLINEVESEVDGVIAKNKFLDLNNLIYSNTYSIDYSNDLCPVSKGALDSFYQVPDIDLSNPVVEWTDYEPTVKGEPISKETILDYGFPVSMLPSEDPLEDGVVWFDGTILRVSRSPGHIRYYTDSPLTFNTGVKTPVNGYIDIIGNDEEYLFDYSGSSVTKIEILNYGDRTSWFKIAYYCTNMVEFVVLATDQSNASIFRSAWSGCSSLTSFPQLDVSQGTKFQFAWEYCSSLTSFPPLDVSKGTNFSGAWFGCSSLTSFPQLDVSQGTNFYGSWAFCSSLTSFPILNVSQGTNFSYTWEYCSSLTSFPSLDVSQGTNFSGAWFDCSSLTSFPSLDISNGTDFTNSWKYCSSLTSFPSLDVSQGTDFAYAWFGCSSLTSFPQLDVSNGTSFANSWKYCSSLPHCPAGNEVTIPVGAVTTNMCYGI